jgi:hypothetical protein
MTDSERKANEQPAKSQCIACKNPIYVGATKCEHCGTFQRRWLSSLIFIAGLSGFLAIAASAVSVLYTFLRDAYALRDPISVVHYSYRKGAIFLNRSNAPVYVKAMLIRSSNNRFLFSDDFNVVVKANDMTIYGNPLLLPGQSANYISTDEWLAALQGLQGKEKCLQIFFSKGIPYSRPSGKIADGWLNYVNGNGEIRDKRLSLDEGLIDCRGDKIWGVAH